jgi:poly(3-hydroxybutyrate) depolymerase
LGQTFAPHELKSPRQVREKDRYDDVGFIDSIVADVLSAYPVNASKVYATGLSAGAGMAYGLGILRPHVFAAIAPVAGVRYYERESTNLFPAYVPPFPSRPLPLLHIQGTSDLVVPYAGGYSSRTGKTYPSAEQWVAGFVAHNGCDVPPISLSLPDVDKTDGSTVQLLRYPNGKSYLGSQGQAHEAEVLFYRVEGGGHSWPSGFVTSYPTHCLPVNPDFEASTVIWEFFSRHELPMKGGRFDQIACSPNAGFHCVFRDAALGQTFRIETCNSLMSGAWSEMTNFVFTAPTVITDRSAGSSGRYYRSVHVSAGR